MALNIFLYGEDSIDAVKQIRAAVLTSIGTGRVVEWSSENTSVKKANGMPLHLLLKECNYFLRLYDADIRAKNPIITITKPNLLNP